MARQIATRFDDSTCKRCGRLFAKGEQVNYAKPIGVWCLEQCIEFPEPTGDLKHALETLHRLEVEGRLVGFTQGLLERYRVTGSISQRQMDCILPYNRPRS
jgi:hypothetical protein